MLKPKTIQFKLFISYSSFIALIIISFIIYFYFYTAGALEKKSSEALYQLSGYIAAQLDMELKNMNSLSDKLLFSKPLKAVYYSDIYEVSNMSIYEQRKFNELVYSITGPQFPFYQINMFQMKGCLAAIGINNNFLTLPRNDIDDSEWAMEVLALNGTKMITVPHKDFFGFSNKEVISLCRSFSQDFGKKPDSIIEIQQDYDKFISIINNAVKTPGIKNEKLQKVYVFNSKGELIYPVVANNSSIIQLYWNEIKKHKGLHTFLVDKPAFGEKQIMAYTYSDFSDWTVVVNEKETSLLEPVIRFRNNTLLAGLIILLITLVLSFFVSKGLTTPIKKLHKFIKSLSLQSLPSETSLKLSSDVMELEDLSRSFSEMCTKLRNSLDEAVASRSHEMQARMLALQSQMNPHFLYNTISVISIMAESDKSIQVVKACTNLSSMLRYVSSDDMSPVTLHDEIEHSLNFLNLMEIRYRDNLNYELQIPDGMLEIRIPKLIIQPLVENSTKYAINADPPWNIRISGKSDLTSWEVSVYDNGDGFEEKTLMSIIDRLESVDLFNMPGMKLDGMGLINIYIRLKLMYGENFIFKVSNNPDGGAMVTVGGSILSKE
jgi:Predicted signal transduction protein with a C-terminal ATPase domain